jgi:DNA invertase Pin-like site-specific DNA recombinase
MPVRARHPFLRHDGGSIRAKEPHASISLDKLAVARQLYERGDMPARRIASAVGISRASLYRALPPGGRGT